MVGQGVHLEHLARRLAATRAGRGGAVLVCGLPGAGASTLCRSAAAAGGLRTAIVTGVAGALDGAGLHDLAAGLGGSGRQAGPPLAAAISCRAMLAAAGEREPTVVVVDDADRLDRASAEALGFCATRLTDTRVLMLVAARADGAGTWEGPGIERLDVGGLDEADAAVLLRRHGGRPVPARVARQVWATTGGNAQALRDAAAALTPAQLDGEGELPELPLPEPIVAAWRERLAALPPPAADALVLAAAAAAAPAAVAVRALRELGVGHAALDDLIACGLLRLVDGAPRPSDGLVRTALLRHVDGAPRPPVGLTRTAVLQAAPPSSQAAARRALAAAWTHAGAPDEAARELVAAPLLADPQAAGELAAAGRAAGASGAHATAAMALRAAAARTLDAGDRARLLLEAAEALGHEGRGPDVLALADEVAAGAPDAAVRSAAELRRAHALLWQGSPGETLDRLLAATEELGGGACAARLLASAAVVSGTLNDVDEARVLARRAQAAADDGSRALAERTLGWVRVLGGDVAGSNALRGDDEALPALHRAYASSAEVAMWHEHDGAAAALRRAALAGTRADLPHLLGCAAEAALRAGDWPTARRHAEESAAAGSRLGRDVARAELVLARLDACRGDDTAARGRAERVLRRVGGLDRLRALAALGALELVCGTAEAAAALLGDASARAAAGGVLEPGVLQIAPDLIEAQVRCGRHADARRVLVTLDHAAAAPGRHWTAAAAWRSRGLLAAAGEVDAAFALAERHVLQLGCPFEHGRLELARGERLRRDGRRVEARRHLRAAVERFGALEAWPWRERAARELRVSGSRAPRARVALRDPLTPQEVEVAQLVAGGMTNRQVAAALFISTKTVEFHLGHVYRKLGVRSRTQLALLRSDSTHRFAGARD